MFGCNAPATVTVPPEAINIRSVAPVDGSVVPVLSVVPVKNLMPLLEETLFIISSVLFCNCMAPSVIVSALNHNLGKSFSLLLSVSASIISVASPEVPDVTVKLPPLIVALLVTVKSPATVVTEEVPKPTSASKITLAP